MPVVSSRAALIEVGDSIHKLTSGLHTWEVFQYLHMTQRTAQHVNLRVCVHLYSGCVLFGHDCHDRVLDFGMPGTARPRSLSTTVTKPMSCRCWARVLPRQRSK
jgi:hypothetical protein